MKNSLIALFVMVVSAVNASAQGMPQEVGRQAAGRYFEPNREPAAVAADDHYLAVHLGKFMDSSSWEWGQHEREDNTGNFSIGVTYRVSKFTDTMDMNLRVEANEYSVVGEKPFKLSFMPVITFPEASSKFPLYFGAGAGAGVFTRQVKDESYLSFDYQLFMGARFFDIYENAGFFVETGLKNHLLLTTSGQFNGVFLAAGAVFTF
jgi:hypothetical protein